MEDKVYTRLASLVQDEWVNGETNKDLYASDYERAISLFNNDGSDRDYEWQSDISIPEFSTQQLTQTALDVSQYFQTRDFVETYIQDASDEALLAADAAEECINRTLNQRMLYHYQKFVRAKTIANITGEVIAECWWDTDNGKEMFNYDIVTDGNVIMSPEYTYSLQQKKWVITRTEKDLEEIKRDARRCGYSPMAIEHLEEKTHTSDTEVKKDLDHMSNIDTNIPKKNRPQMFTVYKRYGKYWVLDGMPGIDEEGKPLEDAKWQEVVVEVAYDGSEYYVIGFNRQRYEDAEGNTFRPIIRGKCYIHPVEDHGLGDARFSGPLAQVINDTINISNDRVMMATMPTLKVKSGSYEHEDDVYVAPGHKIEVTDPDDISELRFSDDVGGALTQMGILIEKMQQANSIYPTTMGAGPSRISETATAVATGERHSNQRTNYKTTTFEYTFLNELYFMILNMTWQWADDQTGDELMGEKVNDFNPSLDYFYKPLSQSIETDQSKDAKIKQLTAILGYMANTPQPKPEMLNYILARIFMLMGDEYVNISDKMFAPDEDLSGEQGNNAPGSVPTGPAGVTQVPLSNQAGIEQSVEEQNVREEL